MNLSRLTKAYIVPIAVYQATSIAGGYGTGREVVQFFTSQGPYGGLLGLLAAALLIGLVAAVTFEFARLFKVYDYRSLIKVLIGPAWIAFEVLYVLLFLIVLAVVASAAGNILSNRLGIPENVGLLLMLSIIGSLIFFGRTVVERSMVAITILLMTAFIYYFISVFTVDNSVILARFAGDPQMSLSSVIPALQFAMYSAPVAAIVLFSTTGIETRREALVSGGLCGLILMLPGLLFHTSFMGRLDQVIQAEVPVYWMIDQLQTPLLLPVYLIAMFGTFLGTGLGFLQAVSERLDTWSTDRKGKPLSRWIHVSVAIGGLLVSAMLGQFGIIALIAKGYGTIAWGFLLVFIVPILTIGAYRVFSFSGTRALS